MFRRMSNINLDFDSNDSSCHKIEVLPFYILSKFKIWKETSKIKFYPKKTNLIIEDIEVFMRIKWDQQLSNITILRKKN